MLYSRTVADEALVCLCRFPFPPHWLRHSQNFVTARLSQHEHSSEWNEAVSLLRASIGDASVVSLDRYAWCALCGCVLSWQVWYVCLVLTLSWPHSVQNRSLWERFQHEKQLMTHQLRVLGGDQDVARRVNEQWLWHGTYHTNPRIICGGLDNIDFRMVRSTCAMIAVPMLCLPLLWATDMAAAFVTDSALLVCGDSTSTGCRWLLWPRCILRRARSVLSW